MRTKGGLVGDLSSTLLAVYDRHDTPLVGSSKAKSHPNRHELHLIAVRQNSQIPRFDEERASIGDGEFNPHAGIPRVVPVAGPALLRGNDWEVAGLAKIPAAHDAVDQRDLTQHGFLAIPARAAEQIDLHRR